MTNYNNIPCPVCDIPFKQGDDITVCPDCGTPHHRHCYAQAGHCAHDDKHESGYEYMLPASAITFPCPMCGTACTNEQLFCEHCGAVLKPADPAASAPALPGAQPGHMQQTPQQDQWGQTPNQGPWQQGQTQGQNSYYGPGGAGIYTLPAELDPRVGTVDDIPVQEWAAFIGPSAETYIAHFKRTDVLGRNTKFCWSAALIAPFYFFYRKMWKYGLMAAVANLILNFPSLLLNLHTLYGIALPLAQSTLSSIATFTFPIMLIFNCMWGLTAFPRYRQFAAEKIKQVQAKNLPQDEHFINLATTGGPSKVMLVLAACVLLYQVVALIIL
ncbi:DUF2628 domain-containing protein [Ruminococcaceae bacterium OttesenSCG-928-N02]|nr:DUF2628 domain-containing protein [Ruminococcaceae bacterium OttesenSCG-928-N02]